MATMQTFESQIDEAIKNAIMIRLRALCDAELKRAQEAIEIQIRTELAQLVLTIFKMYRVERGHGEITIRIENKQESK